MLFRPRVVDSLAVLGVVLLLAFTPAYLAQDPLERDLSDGVEFDFPAPRIGDKATLELVLQWGDDEPVVLPDMQTVQVHAVAPGEIPVHALFSIEESRRPVRAEFSWGTLEVDQWLVRTYFDADGRAVWREETHTDAPEVESGDDEHVAAVVHRWGRPITNGVADANHVANKPVVYHPSDLALVRRDIAANLPAFVANLQGDERYAGIYPEMSAEVVRQRGTEHFVLGRDPYESLMGGKWAGASFGGVQWFAHGITFDDPQGDAWDPYAVGAFGREDWFMAIGGWQVFEAPSNNARLDVWSFPSQVERGTGEPLPLTSYDRFDADRYARPSAAEADLPHITLGTLPDTDTEWLRGLTLPELIELLGSEAATPSVRTAADGRLVAFAWEAGQPRTVDGAAEDGLPSLPLPPGTGADPAAPLTTHRDSWTAAFLTPDGMRVVNATVETGADGHRLVASTDFCEDFNPADHGQLTVDCSNVPDTTTDPSRLIADPLAALERVQAHEDITAFPQRFSFQPLARYEPHYVSPFDGSSFSDWTSPFSYPGESPASGAHHLADDALPQGIIGWLVVHDDGTTSEGGLWGDNGQVASRSSESPRTDDAGLASGSPMSTPSAAGPATPKVLQVRSVEAIAGSLILLGLWAAIRSVFAAKSGAWVPVYAFLYAKIAKEDVLDNERRDAIVSLLDADPGLTTTEIGSRIGMGWGATVHHLETLRRNGVLSMVRHGHRQHYFRAGGMDKQERLLLVYSRDPIYGPFLRTVDDRPGAPLKDIVVHLRQGKAGASRTGKRLVELGLVRREKAGREVRFYPAT